jgi:ParB-like chromosome segregation protein Spo0J
MYSRRPIENPIELDADGLIVDGRHRVVAATLRGDVEIEALGKGQ